MKKIILFITLLINIIAFSQNPGDLDPNFLGNQSHIDFNGYVFTTVLQTDSKILAGGDFTSYNGQSENRLIRLNTDGIKDTSFNIGIGFNAAVNIIKTQPDGKILVGGDFTSYNGLTENRLIRLNNDGSKDTSFNTGTGFNVAVNTIALQPDGKILVGGDFTLYNGVTEYRIIRLNGDGTKDTSFNTGTTGFNAVINTIALQIDGKILTGGFFTLYNGLTENGIVRLNVDGTKDTSFNTGTGFFNGNIRTIAIQTNGLILVGGSLPSYNGVYIWEGFVSLNSNGSLGVSGFSGPRPGSDKREIRTITLQTDGKILLGGTYYTGVPYVGDTLSYFLIRLNSDFSKDSAFNDGGVFDKIINTAEVQSDGKILVGGNFTWYTSGTQSLKRLNSNGSIDVLFNRYLGFDGVVRAAALQSDSKILVGGNFNSYENVTANGIVRLNNDGKYDPTFNIGTGFNSYVSAIVSQSDGKVIVGGGFASYNGINQNRITRLNNNGTKDAAFNIGTGFNGEIYALALQSDGKILAGGWFDSYNGQPHNTIIRLNSDGTKDTSFNIGIGVNTYVNSIVLQPNGKILVSQSVDVLIRLNSDGTRDNTFNIGAGYLNTGFDNIVLQPDGKILVSYSIFINYTQTQSGIIRLNSDGTKDSSFNGIIWDNVQNNTFSIALQSDGKILVGGDFTSYKGINIYGSLIRFNSDGTTDSTFTLSPYLLGVVYTIILQSDNTILLGGTFTNQYPHPAFLQYPYNGFTRLKGGLTLSTSVDFEKNDLKIYPNPVKNLFSITGNETINQIEIFDLLGKRVFIKKETQENINISFLPKGIYILKITGNKGVSSFKIIKE